MAETADLNFHPVPAGTILPWYPAYTKSTQPPSGWAVCDGTLGTPDLRGRFLSGAQGFNDVGSTGGRANIPTDGQHIHARREIPRPGYGDDNADNQYDTEPAGNHNHGGENRPPYTSVVFIMKLS